MNASLLEYLELLAEEPAGRIPLDFDSSCFEQYGTQKEQMGRHYSGTMGFNPVFAFVGRNGFALNSLLRPGNNKDSSGLEAFLKETLSLLPQPLRHRLVARFDSGFYSQQNMTTLHREGIDFIVKARLCDALRTAVTETLEAGRTTVAPTSYGGDVYGEFTYQPKGWPQPLRYCFCLQIEEKEQNGQLLLIPRRQDLIVATTLGAEEATAQQVFEGYRRRGRAEQFIKELKGPLNLEQLPTQSFRANEVMLQAGLLAYNLLLLLEANREGWQRKPSKKRRLTASNAPSAGAAGAPSRRNCFSAPPPLSTMPARWCSRWPDGGWRASSPTGFWSGSKLSGPSRDPPWRRSKKRKSQRAKTKPRQKCVQSSQETAKTAEKSANQGTH